MNGFESRSVSKLEKAEAFEIVPIQFETIPTPISEVFIKQANRNRNAWRALQPKIEVSESEFKNTGMVAGDNWPNTYVTDFESADVINDEDFFSSYTFVGDEVHGEFAGYGEFVYTVGPEDGRLLKVPFVHNVWNEKNFMKQGLAERRYLLMNQISLAKYGMSLSSGFETSPQAVAIWEKFIKQGLAEQVSNDDSGAFRFIK